jgi:hypothetical protein
MTQRLPACRYPETAEGYHLQCGKCCKHSAIEQGIKSHHFHQIASMTGTMTSKTTVAVVVSEVANPIAIPT